MLLSSCSPKCANFEHLPLVVKIELVWQKTCERYSSEGCHKKPDMTRLIKETQLLLLVGDEILLKDIPRFNY